jgi:ribosome maturation factor RimP
MTARNAQGTRRQELLDLLSPVVASHGYDLEDITVTAAGRRSVIRVVVDSDTGVDLDAVAAVARAVSEVLDDESGAGAAFASPYVLEVTSPGVDRPLTEARHWRRAVGRLVRTEIDGTEIRGRITAADEDSVTFDVDGAEVHGQIGGLGPGHVEVEFARPGQASVADAELDDAELDDAELDDAELDDDELDDDELDDAELADPHEELSAPEHGKV